MVQPALRGQLHGDQLSTRHVGTVSQATLLANTNARMHYEIQRTQLSPKTAQVTYETGQLAHFKFLTHPLILISGISCRSSSMSSFL